MLAHLTRYRVKRFDPKTGDRLLEQTALRWSGINAQGDEFQEPVCVVIDVGRTFTMSFDGNLYVTSKNAEKDLAYCRTFSPQQLYNIATCQRNRFGFVLLYDALYGGDDEAEETSPATSEGAEAVASMGSN